MDEEDNSIFVEWCKEKFFKNQGPLFKDKKEGEKTWERKFTSPHIIDLTEHL